MTVEEMSNAILRQCGECENCRLHKLVEEDETRMCFSYAEGNEKEEAVIVENYNYLFGEPEVTPENDSVNHPSHYCQEGSMECIDEMLAIFGTDAVKAFCLCNVWKYRKRAVFKNGEEDLKKSDWYLKKYLELGGKCDLV